MRVLSCLGAVLVVACNGGGGGADEADDDADTASAFDYAGKIEPIWTGTCTCHLQGPSGMMVAPILTLNPERSYDELVEVLSVQVPSMARVQPGDPQSSYLWHKINDSHLDVAGMGTKMPPATMLTVEDIALIEEWIVDGARE